MKNAAPYIRTQLFSLLSGIVYNGAEVPVFESGSEGDEEYKILIADLNPTDYQTKSSKLYAEEQIIEVVYEGPNNVRRHIDAIAEQVMSRIEPTLYTKGIQNSEQWQIVNLNVNAPRYLDDLSADNNYIKRALISVRFQAVER